MPDKLKIPDQPVDPEADYFRRLEIEQKQALAKQLEEERSRTEREEARRVHHLRCGKCGGQLKPHPFRGVEIDVCADCSAVLLDPGELEQLAGKDSSGALAGLAELFSFRRKG